MKDDKQETSLVLSATPEFVERRIHVIRGQKVMLDSDLAELYRVETKNLNKAVLRNADRFPEDFMFRLTSQEANALRFQIGTSKVGRGGRRYLPYAFTELGIAMLSSVLNSERAIQMNIFIMRAFAYLRRVIATNKELEERVNQLELDQLKHGKVLTELYGYVKKFMDTPVPKKGKLGY